MLDGENQSPDWKYDLVLVRLKRIEGEIAPREIPGN